MLHRCFKDVFPAGASEGLGSAPKVTSGSFSDCCFVWFGFDSRWCFGLFGTVADDGCFELFSARNYWNVKMFEFTAMYINFAHAMHQTTVNTSVFCYAIAKHCKYQPKPDESG